MTLSEEELNERKKNAIREVLSALRAPFDATEYKNSKEDGPYTKEQERIQGLIDSDQEYHAKREMLIAEKASLKARVKFNDELPDSKHTMETFREAFDMDKAAYLISSFLFKPEPFYGETVIELDVPSGKLVIADSLYPIFVPAAIGDYNYGRGQHDTALGYAEECKVASAAVGNSCPSLVQKEDGSYLLVSFNDDDEDEENEKSNYEDDEKCVATVITDSWSVELTDYQNWRDNGGEKIKVGSHHGNTVIKVTKGKYRWTVKSHADGWSHYDFNRAEFATLELIEAY